MSPSETSPVISLGRGIALLTGCTALLVVGGLGWLAVQGSLSNWPAVLVAGAVCWVGVIGGLVIAALFSRGGNPIAGVMGGMLIRFGLPLCVGVGLSQSRHWLGEQGVFSLILVNYLALLPIETWLSLPYAQSGPKQPMVGQQATSKEV